MNRLFPRILALPAVRTAALAAAAATLVAAVTVPLVLHRHAGAAPGESSASRVEAGADDRIPGENTAVTLPAIIDESAPPVPVGTTTASRSTATKTAPSAPKGTTAGGQNSAGSGSAQDNGEANYHPRLAYDRIPQATLEYWNVHSLSLYRRVVNAYLNYETTVSYDNREDPYVIYTLLTYYCPVFFADTAIDRDFVNEAYQELTIHYTSNSRAEHEQVIRRFEDACLSVLDGLSDATAAERALIAYCRFTQTLQYDTTMQPALPLESEDYRTCRNPRYREVYDAITSGHGVCTSYARAYAFLLAQLDITAMPVDSAHSSGAADKGHAWTMLRLGDSWYFADPTWEKDGSFTYFGVTTAERVEAGYLPERYWLFDVYTPDFASRYVVSDTRFSSLCGGAYRPQFDRDRHAVSYNNASGKRMPALDLR